MSPAKKYTISFTEKELYYLQHILRHFGDYMSHDDRPDHGLTMLSQYRDLPQDHKSEVYSIMGRIYRRWRKILPNSDTNEI